jgi:hypothetical protein
MNTGDNNAPTPIAPMRGYCVGADRYALYYSTKKQKSNE